MLCAGKLGRASQRAHSKQEIVSILDDMFPPTNSAAKTKLLKDAFAAVYPGHPYKVCLLAVHSFYSAELLCQTSV